MGPKDGGRVINRQSGFYKPPKFDIAQMADLLLEHAKNGGTIYSFSAWLVLSKKWDPKTVPHTNTLKYWVKHNPEFATVANLAHDIALGAEIYLLDAAKMGQIKFYRYKPHEFKLMNMFGWKSKVDMAGNVEVTLDRAAIMSRIATDPAAREMARQLSERLALAAAESEGTIEVQPEKEIANGDSSEESKP